MNKFWKVLRYEYLRHVRRRGFVFGLLSVPLLILIMVGVGFMVANSEVDRRPVGYVDQSGLLADPVAFTSTDSFAAVEDFIAFDSQEQAQAALDEKQIQMFFVLDENTRATGDVKLIALGEPKSSAIGQFEDYVRANLMRDLSPAVQQRLTSGDNLVVRSPDGSQEFGEDAWVSFLLPFVLGFAFIMAVSTSSGYLMQAVVEEKENRTMEIVVTSVSPTQLMAGKTIGLIAVGLTQMLVWLGVVVLVVLIGQRWFPFLGAIRIPPGQALLLAAVMLPSYVMVSALMAAIGATVTENSEGQQVMGLFTLPIVAPYWLVLPLMSNPNSPLAVGLSLFPFTSPVTLTLRMAFGVIPAWQIAAILAIQVLFALGALWLAGRAFRLGMLQYGRRLGLRQLFKRSEA